jgi:hypothetical protein
VTAAAEPKTPEAKDRRKRHGGKEKGESEAADEDAADSDAVVMVVMARVRTTNGVNWVASPRGGQESAAGV